LSQNSKSGDYKDVNIETFQQYKTVFNKQYKTRAEELEAEKNFEKAKKWISENRGLVSHDIGFTSMSDQGEEEHELTQNVEDLLRKGPSDEQRNLTDSLNKTRIHIPTSFDWRDEHYMTPILDQKSCGSCWAHASAAFIEANLAFRNNLSVVVSRQELIDCVKNVAPGNGGCAGGGFTDALDYTHVHGIQTEEDYPLIDAKQASTCYADYSYSAIWRVLKQRYYIREYNIIIFPTDDILKKSMLIYGPLLFASSVSGEDYYHYRYDTLDDH